MNKKTGRDLMSLPVFFVLHLSASYYFHAFNVYLDQYFFQSFNFAIFAFFIKFRNGQTG